MKRARERVGGIGRRTSLLVDGPRRRNLPSFLGVASDGDIRGCTDALVYHQRRRLRRRCERHRVRPEDCSGGAVGSHERRRVRDRKGHQPVVYQRRRVVREFTTGKRVVQTHHRNTLLTCSFDQYRECGVERPLRRPFDGIDADDCSGPRDRGNRRAVEGAPPERGEVVQEVHGTHLCSSADLGGDGAGGKTESSAEMTGHGSSGPPSRCRSCVVCRAPGDAGRHLSTPDATEYRTHVCHRPCRFP